MTKLRANTVWTGLMTDMSSELMDSGSSLSLTSLTGAVTIGDYTKNTDISDPAVATDGDVVLTINKQKFFNIFVDDVDRVQSRPNILDQYAMNAAMDMGEQVDKDLRAAALDTVAAGQTIGGIDVGTDDATFTTAQTTAFYNALRNTVYTLDKAKWPMGDRHLVLNGRAAQILLQHETGRTDGSGDLNDAAVLQGTVGQRFGLMIHKDLNAANGKAKGSNLAVLLRTDACAYAMQIRSTEFYRPEKRFGDAVKGLTVYGAKRVQDARLYVLNQKS